MEFVEITLKIPKELAEGNHERGTVMKFDSYISAPIKKDVAFQAFFGCAVDLAKDILENMKTGQIRGLAPHFIWLMNDVIKLAIRSINQDMHYGNNTEPPKDPQPGGPAE